MPRKINNIVYRISYENLDSRWHLNTLCSLFFVAITWFNLGIYMNLKALFTLVEVI